MNIFSWIAFLLPVVVGIYTVVTTFKDNKGGMKVGYYYFDRYSGSIVAGLANMVLLWTLESLVLTLGLHIINNYF